MSTIYGTISTASTPPESPFSTARQRLRSGMGVPRPWKQMVVSFSIPESFSAAVQRLPTNAAYFHVNYAAVMMFTLFLSLMVHPVSLIVIAVTIFAWLFLYFLRDAPIALWGYAVDERIVLLLLSVFTVILLVLTHATVVLIGLAVGFVATAVHAFFRGTNDLDFDEEDAGGGGDGAAVGLRETASAAYSAP